MVSAGKGFDQKPIVNSKNRSLLKPQARLPPKKIVNRNSLLEQAVNKAQGNLKTAEQADVGKITVQPTNLRKMVASGSASRLP